MAPTRLRLALDAIILSRNGGSTVKEKARSVVLTGINPRRNHDVGRLQEESDTAATATTPTTSSDGKHFGQSEQHSTRTVSHSAPLGRRPTLPMFPSTDWAQFSPTDRKSFRLRTPLITAWSQKGAGGNQNATTRLTVTAPPPPPPPPPAGPSDEELFAQNVKDVYFDYDKSDIRADQSATLQADMLFLNQHPNINFTIEGHWRGRVHRIQRGLG